MTFLAPAVLAGAAAIAIPIAIHLLNRARVKVVRWAAMRFLLESLKKNRRRLQTEDLILLFLRCLFIALLALAFARLVWNPGGAKEAEDFGPFVAVMIVDQSASMGQSNGFQTRFDQAKSAAGNLLAQLAPGSQAALFFAGNTVDQVVPKPISNLPLVRRALDGAGPSNGTSDLSAAVQLAVDALKSFSGSRKEIFVFSDNQASAWQGLEKTRQLLDETPDVHLKVVDLGQKSGEDNLAITSLQAESDVPAAGRMTGFLIGVSNLGSTGAARVRVTLAVDDGPPVDEAVLETLEPGSTEILRLNARFPVAGFYTVRASSPPDRMPADNDRALAVRMIDRKNVAIVEGRAPDRAKGTRDAFFLANALVPVQASQRDGYYLKTKIVPAAWLQAADLASQRIVFLSNVPKLPADASRNLEKFVREGGSLVIFPGADLQAEAYNGDPVLGPMLPAKIGPRNDPAREGKSLAWQAGGYAHPVTALWNDPKNGSLGSVRADSLFPLVLPPPKDPATDPRVIVKFTDGSPAVVEAPYGKGRVVLFSTPATTQGNNFPLHPDFVPFLQRMIGFLTLDKSGDSLAIAPGAVFQARVPDDLVRREIAVIAPGSHGKPHPAGRVEMANRDAVIRYRETAKTGAYRFTVAGTDNVIAAVAVQMDPKESDLRMVPADKLASLQGDGAPAAAASGKQAAAPAPKIRRELWTFFVCAAFVVALVEMALAHRFSFSK